MAKYPNDDLFESTKMSFGEHLEELRVCLFRALIGLMIGFGIGLLVGTYVVDFIQTPLRNAMINFHVEKAIKRLETDYGKEFSPAIRSFIRTYQVVPEDMYFEVNELKRVLSTVQNENPKPQPDAKTTPPAVEKSAAKSPEPADNPNVQIVGDKPSPPNGVVVQARVLHKLDLKVTSLRADEAFMIWMKAGFVFGAIISSPWVFYQVWMFVAAGLYPHEKRYVNIFLPMSLTLFLAGAALAFFFVFDPVLQFLFSFNDKMNIGIDARISEWLSFVLVLPLGFGLSFQLPLVMLFLNRIGLVSLNAYIEKWRIAILAVFVISMVLTPADPVSMLLMALPLSCLYFLGVGMCKWMPKGKNPFAEADEIATK